MYHLCKQSRVYNGHPYQGYTSNNIPAEYETFEEAKKARDVFNKSNPVGWNIYDSVSGELVDGIDFHK